jgi:hypothetical protein
MQVKYNLEGQRFERLVVLKRTKLESGRGVWECMCDCGKTVYAASTDLKRGKVKSCGCRRKEGLFRKYPAGMIDGPEYRAYHAAKKRVEGLDHENYIEYGIKMSDEFLNDFMAFYEHIGPKPEGKWSLGRIDNFKGYERGNIRWELDEEQARNHSKQKNNKSGVVGVHLRDRSGSPSYAAKATVGGVDMQKSFSFKRYGEEVAFFLACEQRDQWMLINELCFGIKFAPTHGLTKEEYERQQANGVCTM